ncbi:hypothetical protein BZG02_05285 [Labilibaculum filiforme]|uniref:Outer membrane protein beta-barrel domain-containing protein n=1 Tax=Labilibaculum filiforme TaxID=1940526 RepID=A0A2N3I1P6_9BACT|nr:outer membrane beta-barrel family protein [Labilibaculum filiforme]PKQ64236.1 hypothetical protein BZG02_05285 [Labilibaculum filiforme]
MKITILTLITFLLLVWSNTMLLGQKLEIKGQVFENKRNESLPFTQVALFEKESNVSLSGTLTDDLGNFTLPVLSKTSYRIQIQFLGYESHVSEIQVDTTSVDLGKIILQASAQNLAEIIVTAEKKTIGKEDGNWVLYPDKLPDGGTNTTIELLSTLPAVAVDMDDNVSIRGRQVTILIDGVKSDDLGALDQISPSSIAKIEVIQNPSAKYDAEGSVINIQLKSPLQSSSSTRLKANVDHFGNHQESFITNKRYKNWGGFLQGSSNRNQFDSKIYSVRENFINQYTPFILEHRTDNVENNSIQFRGGINHRFSKNHFIKFDAQWQENDYSPNLSSDKENRNQEMELLKSTLQNQQTDKDKNMNLLRAQYIGNWDTQTLKIRLNYRNQKETEDRNFQSEDFLPNGDRSSANPYLRNDYQDIKINDLQTAVDYEKSWTEGLKLEAGADYSIEEQNQNSLQEKFDYNLNDWKNNPSKTFDYQYNKSTSAIYGILNGKKNNWHAFVGARLRSIQLKTENFGDEITNKQSNAYLSVLPSITLGHESEFSGISFSYKKSQKIPHANRLNSYRNDANPLNVTFGNPDLKPEKEHSLSLDFSWHNEKYQMSIAAFERIIKDVVMTEYSFVGDTLFRTYKNMATQYLHGSEYTFTYKLIKWCRLNGSASIFHQTFSGESLSIPQKSIWSYNAKIAAYVQLPKNYSMQANYTNNSKTISTYGLKGKLYNLDLGISKSLLDKKLQLSLRGVNLLDSKKQWNESENMQFTSRSTKYQDTRRLVLGVIYKWSHSQ